ncbi:hypothetical protein BS78_08G112300 [Paspalum vaginatum]|nr:hypothetical protein BS78_08G112300 [Paspalum vaginatum]
MEEPDGVQDQQLDPVSEEHPSESNSFDMNDLLSVSIPTAEGASGSDEETIDVSKEQKAKRGGKRLKASGGTGIKLSPSKCKVKRVQRAASLKYYKVIEVPSSKERGKMITKAKCRFCSKKYVYTPEGPTTTLNRHLEKQCTPYLTKLAKAKSELVQGTLTFAPSDGSLHVSPNEYDHDHTRLLIAKMIIAHQYSFRMVEKWFDILMSWMNSNYEPIGRKGIKNECMKVYESEKELLKKSLKQAESISLTTDLWTSNQNIQYMCLVAHYVDVDWVLQCRVLNFVELDPPHIGIVIAQAIFECLVEWKIEDKIMTITLHNASNNDNVVTNLKTKLLARKNT